MKTALLLIPETNGSVNRQIYLSACIQHVINAGFTPLTPAVYELYIDISVEDFIMNMITKPDMNTVFLFTDFGIDKMMLDTIDRCVAQKIELKYVRLQKPKMDSFFTSPFQILRDVSRRTGFTLEQLSSKTRQREIVDARFVYYRRCREVSKASLASIGLPIGKDHASVHHGIREAYNTQNVVKLYEQCYGETEIKKEILDTREKERQGQANAGPVERPVLPYNSMDKREQVVPAEEPVMCAVSKGWAGSPFNGYRPHNA